MDRHQRQATVFRDCVCVFNISSKMSEYILK